MTRTSPLQAEQSPKASSRSGSAPSGAPRGKRNAFDPYVAELRQRVLDELQAVSGSVELASKLGPADAKVQLRKAHSAQRTARLQDAADWLTRHEARLLEEFADGSEIEPSQIDPVVSPVRTPQDADLFRFATLQWSVPVSSGYGRRTRFLVRDRQNGKLMAIFALGDPVIAQSARDSAIGWDKANRNAKLYNVYDAFVLGAVEPYRQLLAGKLAALLTMSNEVRDFLTDKYSANTVGIHGDERVKDPTPVLITTSSALGRSSVYNRVTYDGATKLHSVGYTKGFGHFQFSDSLFGELLDFVRESVLADPKAKVQSSKYGSGPNWRFRVIRTALKALDIPEEALNHNVRREVFLAPTAVGWDAYLRGERDDYEPYDMPAEKIGQYYRDRWAIARADRMSGWRYWRREEGRLTSHLADRQLILGVANGPVYGRVDLGDYSVAVGTGRRRVRGRTPGGKVADGIAYMSRLEGPGLSIDIADTVWESGEREVFGAGLTSGDQRLNAVVDRVRMGVAPSARFRNMSVADIRNASISASGKSATLVKATEDGLRDSLGFDLAMALDSLSEGTVGTRERLLKEEGQRRGQLCVVFDSKDHVLPAVLWSLTRPISILTEDADHPGHPAAPKIQRAAPSSDELMIDD